MPMDYFVWLIRGPSGVWAIDTGFNQEAATARGRRLLRNPATALGLIGVSAADIRNAIVRHLHYDQAGNCDLLPAAPSHMQGRERHFPTGRYMAPQGMHATYDLLHMLRMVGSV